MPDDQAPQRRQDAQVAARQKVEEELLAALPRLHRPAARLVLRLTSRFVVLREVGKTAYIQALDVARAASRALGTTLAKDGVIEAPEDVFFLTRAELSGPLPADAASRVTERRAFYKACQTIALPEYWTGMPTPIPVNEGLGKGSPEAIELHGLGITPGRVSGQVRVVHDPIAEPPLEPGEILVCATTNPAWVTLFLIAGALVIDVGGPLSHGAIAARELGIPCVINTREGTTLLRTGDHVVVDSDHGTVTTVGPREGALK
jgi:pyruvate,water dikinase